MPAARSPQALARVGSRPPLEPADEGGGITQRMVLNILEAFFQRPLVLLIPLFLMLAVGGYAATQSEEEYRSTGVLNATSSELLAELTGNVPTFGFESQATVTRNTLGALLETDAFVSAVVEEAGLTTAVQTGARTMAQIRTSISATTQGDNLVRVSATTPNAQESQRLANATLLTFQNWVIDNDISDAEFEKRIYGDQLVRDQTAFDDAQGDLEDYLLANPAGNEDDRPVAQQIEIDQLTGVVTRAETALGATQDRLNQAQLESDVARNVTLQQMRIIDPPPLPAAPEAGFKAAVLTVGVFGVLGAILSALLIVLAAIFDHTIRVPSDITAKFGLDVLAVVPAKKRS